MRLGSWISIVKGLDDRLRINTVPLHRLPTGHVDCDGMARCRRDCVAELGDYFRRHRQKPGGDGSTIDKRDTRSIILDFTRPCQSTSEIARGAVKQAV